MGPVARAAQERLEQLCLQAILPDGMAHHST
jgi:hypothetical protein